jgi:hypothetical protein
MNLVIVKCADADIVSSFFVIMQEEKPFNYFLNKKTKEVTDIVSRKDLKNYCGFPTKEEAEFFLKNFKRQNKLNILSK